MLRGWKQKCESSKTCTGLWDQQKTVEYLKTGITKYAILEKTCSASRVHDMTPGKTG